MTHFKPEITRAEAQKVINDKFERISFNELCDINSKKPRRFFVEACYLHASKSI